MLWYTLLGLVLGLVVMTPVTRLLLRRAEQRARDAERRARQSERLAELGSMTGGLAHEIKNPLSTIGLNAQLLAEALADSDLPEDQRSRLMRRVDALHHEADRLRSILTDFLQFAGRIKLAPKPCDLVQLVDELSDFFHPQSEQAGVTQRCDLPDGAIPVQVDDGLFKQALLNLMLNAVQAMNPLGRVEGDDLRNHGELILKVRTDGDDAVVHVIDTGPGISPEKLDAIFHPYVSHRSGGTGLGLATSRRIIEEHGGALDADSMPGRGSDFVIRIPMGTHA